MYFEGKYLNSSILLKDTNYLYILENISETPLTRELASDFNNFNYCFLKILEIILGDLMALNKRFQAEKGNATSIREFCKEIFKRFSNILLQDHCKHITVTDRLKMISFDRNTKKASFDKSQIIRKNEKQLCEYLFQKYGEGTKMEHLSRIQQLMITKNLEIFIMNSLYKMKMHFPIIDEFYYHLETFKPDNYKRESWL
jgi:hypothetical protein